MWFSEKAAGKLPRGSSIQGSGNITEHKPETETHSVTWLPYSHSSTPTSSSSKHACMWCWYCYMLPGVPASRPTDISLSVSFRVSERLQRNSPACFNRFWITMPDMNCLQAWSRAYDDHIEASRRKRKGLSSIVNCQIPYTSLRYATQSSVPSTFPSFDIITWNPVTNAFQLPCGHT